MKLNMQNVLKLSGIRRHEHTDQKEFSAINTDSRKISKGEVFLALTGEKFDGRNFIENTIESGAVGCVFSRCDDENKRARIESLIQSNPDVFFIEVEDSLNFLQQLGQLSLSLWRDSVPQAKVVCITGSNGKTTTKEMLWFILDQVMPGRIHKNYKNFNNHLGVPFTQLALSKEHQIAVVEIGTNHPGEIAALSNLADPDLGTITMVGESHLEFLINKEGVFHEKVSLFDYLDQRERPYIINAYDEYLKNYLPQKSTPLVLGPGGVTVEMSTGAVKVHYKEGYTLRNSSLVGDYNFLNLAQAFLLGTQLLPDYAEQLAQACSKFVSDNNRSTWTDWRQRKVFLDAYNANPSSMRAGLTGFKDWIEKNGIQLNQATIVLGEMKELGEGSAQFHRELGQLVSQLGFTRVIYFGGHADDVQAGFGGDLSIFPDSRSVDASQFERLCGESKYLFLKGSRALQLESLIQ